MKKLFLFLLSSAILSTGLISCGGGGDDDIYVITAQKFNAGWGFGFLINPVLEVQSGVVSTNLASNRYGDGDQVTVPGDEEDESGNPNYVTQVGNTIIQNRNVSVSGTNYEATVSYQCVQDLYGASKGIANVSFINVAGLRDEGLLGGLGMLVSAVTTSSGWGTTSGSDSGNRNTVDSLSGCKIDIVLDFSSKKASIYVSASGVHMIDTITGDETEYALINAVPFSITGGITYYPIW